MVYDQESDRNKEIGEKMELLGQVSDVKIKTCARRSTTTNNIVALAQSVEERPGLPNPHRSLESGISQT